MLIVFEPTWFSGVLMELPILNRLTFRSKTIRSVRATRILVLAFGLTLSALPAVAQTQIDLPGPSGSYSSDVRGYWFTAPKDFAITGLEVPTDASSGNQSIAVLRLPAEPPVYDATTDDFEVLFLTQDDPASGVIPVYLEIFAGDVIGILGSRDGVSSYGSGNYASSIDGLPINLQRFGMQFPLASTAPREVWRENFGSISRVRLFYGPIVEKPQPVVTTSNPPKRKAKKKKKQRLSDNNGIRPPRSVTRY